MSESGKALWALIFSLVGGVAGVIVTLDKLSELFTTPKGLGGLLMVIGSIGLAWVSKGLTGFLTPKGD